MASKSQCSKSLLWKHSLYAKMRIWLMLEQLFLYLFFPSIKESGCRAFFNSNSWSLFLFCSKHPYLVEPLDKTVVLNCHAKVVVLSIAVSQKEMAGLWEGKGVSNAMHFSAAVPNVFSCESLPWEAAELAWIHCEEDQTMLELRRLLLSPLPPSWELVMSMIH